MLVKKTGCQAAQRRSVPCLCKQHSHFGCTSVAASSRSNVTGHLAFAVVGGSYFFDVKMFRDNVLIRMLEGVSQSPHRISWRPCLITTLQTPDTPYCVSRFTTPGWWETCAAQPPWVAPETSMALLQGIRTCACDTRWAVQRNMGHPGTSEQKMLAVLEED